MSRTRQREQSEAVRRRILDTARDIIAREGLEALSIRRVTKEMDYSPGTVYHYFESKDQLLLRVMEEGYQRILAQVQPQALDSPPDEAIRRAILRYIEGILACPEEYKVFLLSASPQILAMTSVLAEDATLKRPALQHLAEAVEAGVSAGLFAPCDARVTAQAMWASVFGLLSRLMIEGNVSPDQRQRLIDRQLQLLMKGLYV